MGNCKSHQISEVNNHRNTSAYTVAKQCPCLTDADKELFDKLAKEFIARYCECSLFRMCENPDILFAAFDEYMQSKLGAEHPYFDHYRMIKDVLFLLLSNLESEYTIICHGKLEYRSTFGDVTVASPIKTFCSKSFQDMNHFNKITWGYKIIGIAGIKLCSYPNPNTM